MDKLLAKIEKYGVYAGNLGERTELKAVGAAMPGSMLERMSYMVCRMWYMGLFLGKVRGDYQFLVLSSWFLVIINQLSAISYQLSVVSYQLSEVGFFCDEGRGESTFKGQSLQEVEAYYVELVCIVG